MDKKTIAIMAMGIVLLLIAGYTGVNYYNDKQDAKDFQIYNEGATQAVFTIVNTAYTNGFVDLVVPVMDSNNQTTQQTVRLVPYTGDPNDQSGN